MMFILLEWMGKVHRNLRQIDVSNSWYELRNHEVHIKLKLLLLFLGTGEGQKYTQGKKVSMFYVNRIKP